MNASFMFSLRDIVFQVVFHVDFSITNSLHDRYKKKDLPFWENYQTIQKSQ